jgi:hypothetical protein
MHLQNSGGGYYFTMKLKVTDLFYIALSGWVIATVVFGESALANTLGNQYIYSIGWLACRALLLAKIVHDLMQHKNTTTRIILVAALGAVSSYFSKSIFLVPLFWFLCAGHDIKVEKIVKILFWSYLISDSIVVLLSVFNVIDIGMAYKAVTREITYALGFGHANTLGARAVELLFLYYCYKQERIKMRQYCFVVLIIIALNYITKSRTSVYTAAAMTVLMMMHTRPLSKNKAFHDTKTQRTLFRLSRVMVIAIATFLVIVSINPSIIDNNELAFTGRFAMTARYFAAYPLTLFGQPLAYNSGNYLLTSQTGLTTLDIGYIYLLLGFGIIIFILFLYSESRLFYLYYRQKKYVYIIALLGYAILGIAETSMIRVSYNFTLFFIIDLLWNKQETREKLQESGEMQQ